MAESLSMALAAQVGRPDAQRMVKAVLARVDVERSTLRDCALADAEIVRLLTREALERALTPEEYLGATDVYIDAALADFASMRQKHDAS